MSEFVVSLLAPVAQDRIEEAAHKIAADLDVPAPAMERLISRQAGPITKPVPREQAERVALALNRAGVPAALSRVPAAAEVEPISAGPDAEDDDPVVALRERMAQARERLELERDEAARRAPDEAKAKRRVWLALALLGAVLLFVILQFVLA